MILGRFSEMSPEFIFACAIGVIAMNNGLKNSDTETAIRYLQKYGYLEDNTQTLLPEDASLNRAIALFQEYYQLPGNGNLNNITLELMRKPRCGVEDFSNNALSPLGRAWPRRLLTWNFHLANEEILKTTKTAFEMWATNSSLTFMRKTLNPDILISFREGIHVNKRNGEMCLSPLDGPGGTLAHAFFPTGGENDVTEVHVDKTEPWHISINRNSPDKLYLLQTLVHEIGHTLGLSHSEHKDSIMFAYAPSDPFPVKLSLEDILNIQRLYGIKNKIEPETTSTAPITTTSVSTTTSIVTMDICAIQNVDVVLIIENRIYIAYNKNLWVLNVNGKTYGAPLLLTDYIKNLPTDFKRLSAAYQMPSGDIMLFANHEIYLVKYPSFDLVPTWPRNFPDFGLPANAKINAAINTNRGRSYVIYNDLYVGEIDDCLMRIKTHHTIQKIFPGIPPGITSAFRYIDGHLYFVNKKQYYKLNEFSKTVTSAGEFDFQILGAVCPRDGLLQQLRDLLNRIVRMSSAMTTVNISEEETYEIVS